MGARRATAGVTGTADSALQSGKCVLHPGLADLFEPLIIGSATAHPIEILRNNGMIGLWQRKPIERLVAVITRSCSHPQPNKMIYRVVSELTPCCRDGMAIDLGSPLTSWSISISCIAAPIEILPTAALTSADRPSALANSCEIRSFPPVMLSNCPVAS